MKCRGQHCVCRADNPWLPGYQGPPEDIQQILHDCWMENRKANDAEMIRISEELERLATRALWAIDSAL